MNRQQEKQIRQFFVTSFMVKEDTLLIDLKVTRRVLSSAPRHGGLIRARSVINHQVPDNPVGISALLNQSSRTWAEPARYLGKVATALSAPLPCVGLMTAVLMRRLIVLREQCEDLWVEGFFTVGVTNAVRAGEPVSRSLETTQAGTINIILVTNASLSASAMVTLVQVVTESKTAVLLAQGIRGWTGQPGATGTGTDAVVVVGGGGPAVKYCGTHTKIGEMVGRLVMNGVTRGLRM